MKTVIEMAAKAFETPGTELAFRNDFWTVTQEELERFAELVRVTEREECAKVADSMDPLQDGAIGAAIRARSKDEK